MRLKPDPVAYSNELMSQGRGQEALHYMNGLVDDLTATLKSVTMQRLNVLGYMFEQAASQNDEVKARGHYESALAAYKEGVLSDTRVEDRYFRACYAVRNRPVPIERKFRHLEIVTRLRSVFHLHGDIVELGCYRGLSSWMICATLNEENGGFDGTGYHIFDSFAGLSEPAVEDVITAETRDGERLSQMMRKGIFAYPEEKVRRNLAAFPGITYHPGWLPQSLKGIPERSYRFVHIDVDLFDPTLGALEYFYPRLVSGGVILSDDYRWPGARKAFDLFRERHNAPLEILPGDQAVVRKE
jgi:predicted O-methyltransferase YrrM